MTVQQPAARSPFERLLGDALDRLAPVVRALHRRRNGVFKGEVEVQGARGWAARLCAAAAHLPGDYAGPISVELAADGDGEIWTRRFGRHVMRSRLWAEGGLLHERLGLLRFMFRLEVDQGRLVWTLAGLRALGMPLPAGWFSGLTATAFACGASYCFSVGASAPVVGLLVHYRGTLYVADTVDRGEISAA